MIVVKIELWPGGRDSRAREIGRMVLTNTGGGTPKRGNYTASIMRRGTRGTVQKSGRIDDTDFCETHLENQSPDATILGYPRQSYNVWALVGRAIEAAGIRGSKLPKNGGERVT